MSRSSVETNAPGSPIDRVKAAPARAKVMLARARARWGWVDVVLATFKRFGDDDSGTSAAALTYYAFFAIFPLLLFAAAAVGYLTFGNEDLRTDIINAAVNGVPVVRDALKPGGLAFIEAHRSALAGTGLVLALYSGTGVIVALQHALNRVFHVPHEGNWFQKRFRSLKWLVVLGVTALLSLAMTTVAGLADGWVSSSLGYVGGLAISTVTFMTAFKFLVAVDLSWRDVLPGAIVAAIIFEILKVGGGLYLSHGDSARNDTYGTLAGAAALLVASYLISQVTLLAAEVNAVLIERRAQRGSPQQIEEDA
ncbi:MAG TPA: YihY/virulence factor BrkB family protein [Actinomycetota bacterium]|nr:YihY/virulence factor BrkB family protein [Actinomycetota bacterium]